ncbi:MAG TPA: D-alanyl-D-alanine carboxypeptidase family protein [Saprospiraceae bacterium]|nr:D-alanyl-D-alanine carboxypeptidase family protein [Saprospiraceae bacterium]
MNRFTSLIEELQVVNRPTVWVKAQGKEGKDHSKILKKVRLAARSRVQRAYLKLNGTNPTYGQRWQREGLRLARKLIDRKINNISTITDKLSTMHVVLSSEKRFSRKYDASYCKLWGAYYNRRDRLIHLCPSFFNKKEEEQIRTLIHESAHAAGVGESKGESYLTIYDGQTSFNDINVADGWAHFVHVLLDLPLDKPDTITGEGMAMSRDGADKSATAEISQGDDFISSVLNFIFRDHRTNEKLSEELRNLAATALWDLIKAANLQQHFPKPPRGLPSPAWLLMEEVQKAFHHAYRMEKFPTAVRKIIHQKWKRAYDLAKRQWSKGMTGGLSAKHLDWEGASAEQLAFMRKVYRHNLKRSSRNRNQLGNIPQNELEEVENGYQLRKSAAQAFENLLAAAREAIKKAGIDVKIGITSAYRSPAHQFRLWQKYFPDYYQRTKAERKVLEGGEYGDKAVAHLAAFTRKRIAMPGFSNHNDGLAVDIKNVQEGEYIRNRTTNTAVAKWKASWLWKWLVDHAGSFGFEQEAGINEPWHWVYTKTSELADDQPTSPSIDTIAQQLYQRFNRSEIFGLLDAINGLVLQHSSTNFQLSASVGSRGDNQTKDVKALKNRLRDLGFDWLRADDNLDKDTIRTIKLFQSIIQGKQSVGGDGRVDVKGDSTSTYDWLRAANAPRWKQMPQSGKGYEDTDRAASNINDGKVLMNWGTDWLIDTIIAAGIHYEDHYRKGDTNTPLIHTNDLSLRKGGDTRDHSGHETGLMVDLRLPRTDGRIGGVKWNDQFGLYDQDAAEAIIKAFRAQPLFEVCYFNDEVLIKKGLCKKASGHDDHIHIKVKPPSMK